MSEHGVPRSAYGSTLFGVGLAVSGLLLAMVGGADLMAAVALAGCAGAVSAIGGRALAGATAFAMLLIALLHGLYSSGAAEWVAIVGLSAGVLAPRRIVSPSASSLWAIIPLIIVLAYFTFHRASPNGAISVAALLVGSCAGAVGGFVSAKRILSGGKVVGARYSIGDGQSLSQTARFLLLGRIAGGMSHELSQALNVITMANGNLGYVLDRANVPEPQGTQLTERVRKIATHADVAGRMLGHFRWFGQDGGREGVDMTVGTALERAVAATKAAARKCGVAVEIRGDALSHPVPLRHGTIEMMATAALLDVIQLLCQRAADSVPPQAITLEATRTATDIEISVLSRSGDDLPPVVDEVADATFDLVARLAASCRSELRRIGQKGDPVRFVLRLDRDVV